MLEHHLMCGRGEEAVAVQVLDFVALRSSTESGTR
jgi:hypothetical protein